MEQKDVGAGIVARELLHQAHRIGWLLEPNVNRARQYDLLHLAGPNPLEHTRHAGLPLGPRNHLGDGASGHTSGGGPRGSGRLSFLARQSGVEMIEIPAGRIPRGLQVFGRSDTMPRP